MQKRVNSVQRSNKRDWTIHMIFLVLFGTNKHLYIFSKTTYCIRPKGSCNFVSLWKNLLVLIYSKFHSKSSDYLYKLKLNYHTALYTACCITASHVSRNEFRHILSVIMLIPACLGFYSQSIFPFLCFSLCSQIVLLAEINYLWL